MVEASMLASMASSAHNVTSPAAATSPICTPFGPLSVAISANWASSRRAVEGVARVGFLDDDTPVAPAPAPVPVAVPVGAAGVAANEWSAN